MYYSYNLFFHELFKTFVTDKQSFALIDAPFEFKNQFEGSRFVLKNVTLFKISWWMRVIKTRRRQRWWRLSPVLYQLQPSQLLEILITRSGSDWWNCCCVGETETLCSMSKPGDTRLALKADVQTKCLQIAFKLKLIFFTNVFYFHLCLIKIIFLNPLSEVWDICSLVMYSSN